MSNIALLTIGSEILDGRIQDSNSKWVVDRLTSSGHSVVSIATCADHEKEIIEALEFLCRRADFVIVSGGLGPTDDDLTREAISQYCAAPLELQNDLLQKLQERFAKRGVVFDPSNAKQAMLPKGSERIPNPKGSAIGFVIQKRFPKNHWIFCLPGVPLELKAMFDESVLPYIMNKGGDLQRPKQVVLRVFGRTESELGGVVSRLKLPKSLFVAYQTSFPENILVLRGDELEVKQAAGRVEQELGGQFVYSKSPEDSLAEVVHRLILEKNLSLALAESCTGGLIAKSLTDFSGSSKYFLGGVVSYSNAAKREFLGVSNSSLETNGAVSYTTARQMAEGALRRFGADLALSVTGVAGPEGGSPEKPVGLFFLGFASSQGATAYRCFYPGSRDRIRTYAQWMGLDLLRRNLIGLSPHELLERDSSS